VIKRQFIKRNNKGAVLFST